MSSTVVPPDSGHWLTDTGRIGGFAYGIGVSVGILLLITTITLTSYYCTRSHLSNSPTTTPRTRRRQRQTNGIIPPGQERFNFDGGGQNDDVVVEVLGLNEEVIKSFPKLLYEEARVSYSLQRESTTTSCCSICLADYIKTDIIRVLPHCNHLFHDQCVDPWLMLHATCPVCRTSPLPSPAMTPVADVVVPFSRRPMDV